MLGVEFVPVVGYGDVPFCHNSCTCIDVFQVACRQVKGHILDDQCTRTSVWLFVVLNVPTGLGDSLTRGVGMFPTHHAR